MQNNTITIKNFKDLRLLESESQVNQTQFLTTKEDIKILAAQDDQWQN
ncbi:hypothetical protein M0Q39_06130 [Patescibacteria group bacterium]|jgi:hypothetical protein|nr:hypothetical protein [Patescibacteria group bacterium]